METIAYMLVSDILDEELIPNFSTLLINMKKKENAYLLSITLGSGNL